MNQTNDATTPVPPSRTAFKWRRAGTPLLFLACAVGLWLFLPKPALLPVVTVLPSDYSIPAPPLPVPDRWIPMKAGWLWKLRYALLGKPATFDIETKLIRFREPGIPSLQQVLNGLPPFVSTNGVRAWILPDKEVKALGLRLELEEECEYQTGRMTLGQGVLATLSGTTSPLVQGSQIAAGYTITCAVHKRGDSIELSGRFTSSEVVTNALTRSPDPKEDISLHTNLMLVANMQIPLGLGVFLYDTNRSDVHSGGVAILIRPKVW